MREIVFDTETTGLERLEDRVIEIGGVELVNRFPTGRTFHKFINPQGRQVHPDALAVHGISNEQLLDKPVFAEILDEFLEFIDGARLVAHNAMFDLGFINAELARLDQAEITSEHIVDTLALARRKHPIGRTRWMRSASVMVSTIRTAPCTAHCSTRRFWLKSISN